MSDNGKRRLRLMPEVLPDPTPSGQGSPRQRTLKNMERLLAAAAATAALQAGCSNKAPDPPVVAEDRAAQASATATATAAPTQAPTAVTAAPTGQAQTVPTPTAAPTGTAVVAVHPSATAPPHPTAVPVIPTRGYGVVDPMPPPARIPPPPPKKP